MGESHGDLVVKCVRRGKRSEIMRSLFSLVLAATACALPLKTAGAQVISVSNPGFENPPISLCSFGTAATGWTSAGDAALWRCGMFGQCLNSYRVGPPEGQQVAYINSGTLSQTLATNLAANTQYTLRVKVGRRFDCCQSSGIDYTVQLRAGAALLAQDVGSIIITSGTFRMATVRFSTGTSHPNLGQALQIRLAQGTNGQANFDDVQLTAAAADCNSNGVFDAIDIANGAADANGNGVPDSCETRTCVADVNPPIIGDGLVNVGDLLAVITAWGPCNGCSADLAPAHGNASVNVSDLLGVITAWGPCP